MKTIVINTSKEAVETKLNLLFKAPCDRNSLLWIDSDLANIQQETVSIRQALVDDTDIVDKDYNLIVLVDLYLLPHGSDSKATKIYKSLIARYIAVNVVQELFSKEGLTPGLTSIYFVDSSVDSAPVYEFDSLNVEEQRRAENLKALEEEERIAEALSASEDEELLDVYEDAAPKKTTPLKRTPQEKLIMQLFGWTPETTTENISWLLPIGFDKNLDFSTIFALEVAAISARPKGQVVVDLLIDVIENLVSATKTIENQGKSGIELVYMPSNAPLTYSISCSTFHFERDNDQMIIEGFFNVFANIFRCVQTKTIENKLDIYSSEKIKEFLLSTLKRYKHFSKEENITVKFEPVASLYTEDIKTKIFEERKKVAAIINQTQNQTVDEIIENIMSETVAQKKSVVTNKMYGLDREFHELVESIFNNYDPDLIKEQNNRIVKQCLTGLWTWRDKQTAENFRQTVDNVLKTSKIATKENVREHLTFISDEYEQEYSDLINEVTDAEHRLASNKNILLETKDLVLKYGDLMRKGKWYLMSFIGAIIAVCISIIPYIYVEHYAGNDNLVFKIMYLLFTAGFAALYGVSASIYMGRILSKKRELTWQLEELKTKSEQERRESLIALYTYYSETVVKTENHCLLWREILRRDRENSKKGIKRNNHIKRLQFLIGEVKRFMTMLKLDCEDDACMVNEEDEKRYEKEGLCLNAEESFHSACNQRIYSVLSDDKSKKPNDDEEGGI